MRIAIVGASGNSGTGLLQALRGEPEIDEIVGIARRSPDTGARPYDAARWELVDIAMPSVDSAADDRVVDRLADAIAGADTVVHLAWLIQPNRQRDLLRRANVDGTRRVIEACVRAGVSHLVCASSVGVYAGVSDDAPRAESWPTRGVPTAHYSVDKVAQEGLLDEAERRGLSVARVRPALVFDAEAGAHIVRLFVGALVPPALLRPGAMPLIALPAGVRVQVVHGDDLADAYRRIILQRATGAFNIATDPVLREQDLADVIARGRRVALPPRVLRPVMHAAWRARALAADPGWLDMAMSVPVMSTERARHELGWAPRHDAHATLREMLQGMADGAGTASPPMRPRTEWPHDQRPDGDDAPDSVAGPGAESSGPRAPVELERDILGLYLSDHLTGATAGVQRLERMAEAYADTDLGPDIARISREIGEEREFLHRLIGTLEFRRRPHRQAAAWIAERVGRLKTNGRPLGSPMTPVLEIELLRGAVAGKLSGWETMRTLAPDLGLPEEVFADLVERSRAQIAILERLHAHVVPEAFREGEID
ncbi:NAD-dependent epimerase/dehydratase family protein [Microbacterium album]|nr:NAD-dependent epimerase/dehydratase family protein [Microbacterium album]